MDIFSYSSYSAATVDAQIISFLTIIAGIISAILGIWVLCSIISMSRSLKDIRNILQVHFTIQDTPDRKIEHKELKIEPRKADDDPEE